MSADCDPPWMSTRERPSDRGTATSRRLRIAVGAEIRLARQGVGLSLRTVADAVGSSAASLSRLERGLMTDVSLDLLARIAAVVGLELAVRAFPGAHPLRDAAHVMLLSALRSRLHRRLRWALEVPLPIIGDPRRWDGLIADGEWRYGVEAETTPRDWQALAGRLALKARDGGTDGVLLLLPETRRVRAFLGAAESMIPVTFPVPARTALSRLAAGQNPGGNAIVVLRMPVARGALPTAAAAPRGGLPTAVAAARGGLPTAVAAAITKDDRARNRSSAVAPRPNTATESSRVATRRTSASRGAADHR